MQLHSWLNNPTDFDIGLRLLDKFAPGKNISFKKRARKFGANSYYKKKLFQLVNDINLSIPDPVPSASDRPKPKFKKHIEKHREDFPPDLQELWDKRLALFKEAAFHHSRVLMLSPKQQEMAIVKVMTNRSLINEIWDKLDYYKINKKRMPEFKPLSEGEYFKALSRRNTLRTYKSRYRRKPEKFEKFENEFERLNKIVEAGKKANL